MPDPCRPLASVLCNTNWQKWSLQGCRYCIHAHKIILTEEMNCGAYVFACVCSKTHLEGFKEDGVFSPRLRLSGSTYIRTMHCLQESLPGKCLICNRRIWLRLEVWFGFQRGGMCMQLGGVVGNLKSGLLTKLIYRDVRICQHMLHKRLPQSEPRFFPLAIACYKSLLKQRWNLSFNQFLFRSLTFNKCIQNFFTPHY